MNSPALKNNDNDSPLEENWERQTLLNSSSGNYGTNSNSTSISDLSLEFSKSLTTTSWSEVSHITRASLPLIVTFLLQYSLTVASVLSVGHLGKTELGAVSLAAMTANITGFAVIQGLATCLDTLCAQAYGAGNHSMVGEYFQKCILLICAFFMPVALIWVFAAQPIISSVCDDLELVLLSQTYLRTILLGVPGYIVFECGKRFLQAQGIFYASTLVLVICAPVNAFLNYILVWNPRIGLGFIGAPLAVAISNWLMAILLICFITFVDGNKCWTKPSCNRLFQNWNVMICLAVPGVIMVEAEFLAYEVLTILCSKFGTTALAAQSITSTTMSLFYQIPFSIGLVVSTRIANYIGSREVASAKTTTYVAMLLILAVAFIDSCCIYLARNLLGSIYSRDEEVISKVSDMGIVLACCHLLDAPCAVFCGILRGLGRQRIGGYLNLTGYYVVAVPLAIYFGFVLDLQLKGLWMGIASALIFITSVQAWYIMSCSYEKAAYEAFKRQIEV